MKQIIAALIVAVLSLPAFAAEKGEMYIGPALGYHFFDKDHDLDDKAEGGLRFGYFFMGDHSVELEADYTDTDHDTAGSTGVTSLSLSGVKFFDVSERFKPMVFLGIGGLFHENDMASLVAGVGARYIASENISLDLRVKDMLHSIGARNDVIPSIALNFHFGKPAPVVKTETAPEPEEKTEPAVEEKKPEQAAVVKKDSDGDGVYDEDDKCPETPAGYPVNSAGCTPDSDGDGVYDFEDRCPNSMAGVKVNSAGCFISATLNINFKTNSSEIDESYLGDIQKFAVFLKMNSHVKAEIQGHTDSKGAAEYNLQLSQKRAESVKKILVDRYGISSSRLSAAGYGENMPLVPNDTPENMKKNRRIDTVVK